MEKEPAAKCPNCGAKYTHLKPEHLGKSIKCVKCGQSFRLEPEGATGPAQTIMFNAPNPPAEPATTVLYDEAPPAPAQTTIYDNEQQNEPSATIIHEQSPLETVMEETGPAITITAPALEEDVAEAPESAEAENVPLDWTPGDNILNLYQVESLLGEGGMGKVYKVRHLGWDTTLAVKCPRPEELKRAGGAENFEREAETWVNLGLHPNIVSCYYVRRLGGLPRVFAEFIDGGSMQEWIRKGQLKDLGAMLDVSIQFAWGLHYSHELGIVHQDIKPANVMMTANGVAKVTDFGLARAWGGGAGESSGAVAAGGMTLAYCSPEQAERKPLSRRSDIWSWAVSILEMFTGEVTWMSGAVADAALEDFLARKATATAMPKALAELLKWCLAQEPSGRPATMMDVARVLVEIYKKETGIPYPRREPKTSKAMADSLNNRAVSLLDLGRAQEATNLWEEALKTQPHHPEATFNWSMAQWRAGHLTDLDTTHSLAEAFKSHPESWVCPYLAGLAHMERDDYATAVEILASAVQLEGPKEVETAIVASKERLEKSRRLINSLLAHPKGVNGVDISSGPSPLLITGGDDRVAIIWNAQTGAMVKELAQGHSSINRVAISDDGKLAVTATYKTLFFWNPANGVQIRSVDAHEGWIGAVSLSAGGSRLITSGWDGLVKLINTSTGETEHSFEDCSGGAVISANGKVAAYGAASNKVNVINAHTGAKVMEIVTDPGPISLSADGALLACASLDNTIKVFESATGRLLKTLTGLSECITSVHISSDGKQVLGGGYDGSVRLWNVRSGRLIRTFEGHSDVVNCVKLNAEGTLAVSCGMDGAVKLWAVTAQEPFRAPMALCRITDSETALSAGVEYETRLSEAREAISANDLPLAVGKIREARSQKGYSRGAEALGLLGSLYLRLPRQILLGGWEGAALTGHGADVTAVDISLDGGMALSACADRRIRLWAVETGALIKDLEGHTDRVNTARISRDGGYVLSGSGDWKVKLWDTGTGACLKTFEGHGGPVNSVAFSGDGVFGVSGGGDGMVYLWGINSGRAARRFAGHGGAVNSVDITGDARFIISGGDDKDLRLWDTVSGDMITVLRGHTRSVHSVAFSFDGSQAVSGGADGAIRLWNIATGELLRVIEDGGEIMSVSISVDGGRIISGGAEGAIKLWDTATGQLIRSFKGHSSAVSSARLGWDGRYAVSGSADRALKVWILDWELDGKTPGLWDEKALTYLSGFLMEKAPYAGALPEGRDPFENEITASLTRKGKPAWDEEDIENLFFTLGCAGFGWLERAGVERRLKELAANWAPPPPPDRTIYTKTRQIVEGIYDKEMEEKGAVLITEGESAAPKAPEKKPSFFARLFGRGGKK
ncbi:MAG: protein kinase [Nitrospinae bacterium]|nr:protein kinase [Nitrospinota bacterium]